MTERIQQQTDQINTTIWSWFLRILSINVLINNWFSAFFSSMAGASQQPTTQSTNESSDVNTLVSSQTAENQNISYSILLNKLPGELKGEVLSHLALHDIHSVLFSNHDIYQDLKNSGALDFLKLQHQMKRICNLIAVEGEDNQNKAEAMLAASRSSPSLLSSMLVGRTRIQDAAGRTFNAMSAYGYAFWAGDTRMRNMMRQYMDEETQAQAYAECKKIEEEGVRFTAQGETVFGSKCFDLQPLIQAYREFITIVNALVEAYGWNDRTWARANELWLNIGREQAKLTTHLAQEICSDFSGLYLNRTVKVNNATLGAEDSWEFSHAPSELGVSCSILKGTNDKPVATCLRGTNWQVALPMDFQAIEALGQARLVSERQQTLEELKPVEPSVQLNV